jgi:hypothetical protein
MTTQRLSRTRTFPLALVTCGWLACGAHASPVSQTISYVTQGEIDGKQYGAPDAGRIQLQNETGVITGPGPVTLGSFMLPDYNDNFQATYSGTPFSSLVSFFRGTDTTGPAAAQLELSGVLNGQIQGPSSNVVATVTSIRQLGSLSPPLSIDGFSVPPVTITLPPGLDPSLSVIYPVGWQADVSASFLSHLNAVPEPGSMAVFAAALGLGLWNRRRVPR